MTTSGGAYGICISCDAKFAGDQATIDRCKAEAGWGFEHHGYHYDNTCQIHHPVDSGDPCSHLCTESCSVCEAPCMAGGLASEECKACAETTNCEACISCHMYASLFKANSTDFTNGTNFTMPDCGQCIDASSECGECMRRCGSCIGNNDPVALNSDGEPCAACDACTQWIPCALSSGPAPGDNARNEMKFCTQDNTPVYARVSRLFFFFCLPCDIDFSSLSRFFLFFLLLLTTTILYHHHHQQQQQLSVFRTVPDRPCNVRTLPRRLHLRKARLMSRILVGCRLRVTHGCLRGRQILHASP